MPGKHLPEVLKPHILPFDWDVRRVWMLEAATHRIKCSEFAYLLELPLWSSCAGQGMLFDTCPGDVIRDRALSPYQTRRLEEVDLMYPVDVLLLDNRRWILDGVHRIARHFQLKHPEIPVRFHDFRVVPDILVKQ
ncbi:hypothetical protein [Quatrionicoccus australiensis]|uniref:hypothetical protein n=1 Tax=Quatrionicoccus australiensis TaxID=138118 RepID=UPI001CF97658|nr:hypothetical protein [Quatrionicoccus australiensis]MCB4358824.1 hypothetical protein [Quatrionicoccus australiensis]